MGRGKLPMSLIENHKARKLAMEKRMINLKKKAYELSTLCDVPVCVIVYNPDDLPNSEMPLLYPESRDEARSIISRYISSPKEGNCSKRRLNPDDTVQGDIKRRRIGDSTNPNLVSSGLEGLSRDQLCDMASVLDSKLQFVQNRIATGFGNHGEISEFDRDLQLWCANFCDQPQQQEEEGELGLRSANFCDQAQQEEGELGLWCADFCDQPQQEQALGFLPDEMTFFYFADQQHFLGSN